MDYKTNARYFRPFAWKPGAGLFVFGIILTAAGVPAGGVPLLLLGVAWIAYLYYTQVPDHVLDEALKSQLLGAEQRAFSKLNLEPSQVASVKPLRVYGYRRAGFEKAKRGKDGTWRTSDGSATLVFFDEHQLYAYSWAFSLINTRRHTVESTDDYFFRDVVSISVATETWQPPPTKGFTGKVSLTPQESYEVFKLTTSGGTSVTCPVYDEESRQSIQGARTYISEKKRGQH